VKIIIGKYEATIYREGDGYTGAISLGFDAAGKRQRVKRKGRTKAQVKDKLREVVGDLEAGVTATENYTVQEAVDDFLDQGMKGKAKETIDNYRSLASHHLIPYVGAARLKKLTADELDKWMDERAEELSNRTLRLIPPDPGARDPPRAGPRQSAPQRRQPDHPARGQGRPPVTGHDPGTGD